MRTDQLATMAMRTLTGTVVLTGTVILTVTVVLTVTRATRARRAQQGSLGTNSRRLRTRPGGNVTSVPAAGPKRTRRPGF